MTADPIHTTNKNHLPIFGADEKLLSFLKKQIEHPLLPIQEDNLISFLSAAPHLNQLAIVVLKATERQFPQKSLYLLNQLNIKHVIFIVSEMASVEYQQTVFEKIKTDFYQTFPDWQTKKHYFIPVDNQSTENIVQLGKKMAWYQHHTLIDILTEAIESSVIPTPAMRFLVNTVDEIANNWITGQLICGDIHIGDSVRLQPSGQISTIEEIALQHDQIYSLKLADEIAISIGDVISSTDHPVEIADQFECTIIWNDSTPLLVGRQYLLQSAGRTVSASVTKIKNHIGLPRNNSADYLTKGEIAICNISCNQKLPFERFCDNQKLGNLVFINEKNHITGFAMVHFPLRRASNIHLQHTEINKASRAQLKQQKPCVLWFTGLSGAGKSSIANVVEKTLHQYGYHTYLLDGDNVRHGLNRDLGFTDADRVENIRRIAEVAKLMVDAGLIVLTAFISPFRAEREMARALMAEDEFIEVFVDVPLAVAEQRDPKGLYKKVRRGELKNFTGIDSCYEAPLLAEIKLDTTQLSVSQSAERVVKYLLNNNYLEKIKNQN